MACVLYNFDPFESSGALLALATERAPDQQARDA